MAEQDRDLAWAAEDARQNEMAEDAYGQWLAHGGGSQAAQPMRLGRGQEDDLRKWRDEAKRRVAGILGSCRCEDRTAVLEATERALMLLDRMPEPGLLQRLEMDYEIVASAEEVIQRRYGGNPTLRLVDLDAVLAELAQKRKVLLAQAMEVGDD